jgi:hypothetical protein
MAPLMGLMAKSMMKKCLGKDFAELGAVAESRPAN